MPEMTGGGGHFSQHVSLVKLFLITLYYISPIFYLTVPSKILFTLMGSSLPFCVRLTGSLVNPLTQGTLALGHNCLLHQLFKHNKDQHTMYSFYKI